MNIENEIRLRVEFIQSVLHDAKADGIVFGNSGGKDSALVGILCKMACDNTLGIIMPCGSKQNYNQDKTDAEALASKFGIETRIVDLAQSRQMLVWAIEPSVKLNVPAINNIAPRLRMTTLYAVAATENRLVAGTGNRSEGHMGYFTKWGDGAYDFNPIADLTVTEIYDYLRFLDAPQAIIDKAPSAGLFDGQTDASEMGIPYDIIDSYLLGNEVGDSHLQIIERYHQRSVHKRNLPKIFSNN